MGKNNGTKAVSQLVGLLLCILLIQTAFAEGNAANEITIIGNATNENTTIGNATNENTTIENSTNENTIIENASVNSIIPSCYYTYLNAGTATQFTVSFTNGGNETLFLTPEVAAMPYSVNSINKSWITISPANATISPGSVQDFNVAINVPWDAEGGYYQGNIAFTDDLVLNPTQYANPMQLYVSIQAQPKIELQTGYISDTVEAGKEYEYKLKIKNVAPKDITIDPKLNNYNPGYPQAFGNDTIKISAPSIIKAGEITDMTIKVHLPENATGYYNGHVNMNVNEKINDWSAPGIDLSFNIWQPPVVPYVKTFSTTTNDPITIEISANKYDQSNGFRISQKYQGPSFELGLTHNSIPINMTFVKSVENGGVSLVNWYYPTWAMENGGVYQNNNNHYVATYTVPGAIGDWELTILPKNTNNFEYSITVGNNNPATIGTATNETASNESTEAGNTSTGNTTDDNISTEDSINDVVADFSASPTIDKVPMTVKFKDKSTGSPTSWSWNFGDKKTSTAQNPVHKYAKAGKYIVSLTVKNSDSSNTKTMTDYITAKKK